MRTLLADSYGNLWIGTRTGGVAVYNPTGVALSTPGELASRAATTFTLAPNPAAGGTVARFADLPPSQLEVVDVLGRRGRLMAVIPGGITQEISLAGLPAGRYTVCADGRRTTRALSIVAE